MENSNIGWTDHTWNPYQGCTKVSAACQFCYIGNVMRRAGREPFQGPMRTSAANWRKPATWNRKAARAGQRQRVFSTSLSDFFHAGADEWRPAAWDVIRACTQLDWLILTKRPERIAEHLPPDWGTGFPNVWLGVTVEESRQLHRVETLAQIPAVIRFVSAEPLLERIDFRPFLENGQIDWIITGCEQAHQDKRRAMDLGWVRDVHAQCTDAGVPHFFKQYYIGNQLQKDGLLDGKVCQVWPTPAVQ